MKGKVIEIICEILAKDTDEIMEQFDDRNIWDSLQRVEILFALEEEFDIQFSEDELAAMITPKKLCEAVLRKVEQI